MLPRPMATGQTRRKVDQSSASRASHETSRRQARSLSRRTRCLQRRGGDKATRRRSFSSAASKLRGSFQCDRATGGRLCVGSDRKQFGGSGSKVFGPIGGE